MAVDLDELKPIERNDFRRANGAPQIVDKLGKNQRYSRPSGWGKELDDENALVNWKLDRAIIGMAKDPALQARGAAVHEGDEGKKDRAALREASIAAGRGAQAADIGTALHAMSERWEKEPGFDPGKAFTPSLQAYEAGMKKLGLVSERFEYQIVNDEYRIAGTADRLYRLTVPLKTPSGSILPVGTLIVGDLKTGKSLDFSLPGYLVQMALYSQGEFYDVVNDLYLPTPDINQDWGILVHMPSQGDHAGTCEFLWADLEVGNYGAYLVHEVRTWRKRWKSGEYGAAEIEPGVSRETVTSVLAVAAELGLDDVVERVELLDVLAWFKHRIAVIGADTKAREKLLQRWDPDVPTPNKIDSLEQIDLIIPIIEKIEAEHELPFGDTDPRVLAAAGKKKS